MSKAPAKKLKAAGKQRKPVKAQASKRSTAKAQREPSILTRLVSRLVSLTLLLIISMPLALVLWLETVDWRAPPDALPRSTSTATATPVGEPKPLAEDGTGPTLQDWTITDTALGQIGFTVQRPSEEEAAEVEEPDAEAADQDEPEDEAPLDQPETAELAEDATEPGVTAEDDGRLPVIILLGGAPEGRQALTYMPPVGDNVVISLDWPMPVPDDLPRGWDLVPSALDLRTDILSAPGQVSAVYFWARSQPWADPDRISLIGVSLGALVAPAAQFLIQEQTEGQPLAATLLAFGGAGIEDMVQSNPTLAKAPAFIDRPWAIDALGWAAGRALYPIEPAEYLPKLRGQFMVVNASADGVIPASAVERLTNLTPAPKDTLTIDGGHIGPDPETPRILRTLSAVATGWLVGQGVVNAP